MQEVTRKGEQRTLFPDERSAFEIAAFEARRRRNRSLKRYAGMDLDAYEAILVRQRGVCKSCGEPPGPGEILVVDHDHKCCPSQRSCGRCVRGLIHDECNQLVGFVEPRPTRAAKAVLYVMECRNGNTGRLAFDPPV